MSPRPPIGGGWLTGRERPSCRRGCSAVARRPAATICTASRCGRGSPLVLPVVCRGLENLLDGPDHDRDDQGSQRVELGLVLTLSAGIRPRSEARSAAKPRSSRSIASGGSQAPESLAREEAEVATMLVDVVEQDRGHLRARQAGAGRGSRGSNQLRSFSRLSSTSARPSASTLSKCR